MTWVLYRVDWSAFVRYLGGANYLAFIPVIVVFVIALTSADVLATVHIYHRFVAGISYKDLL